MWLMRNFSIFFSSQRLNIDPTQSTLEFRYRFFCRRIKCNKCQKILSHIYFVECFVLSMCICPLVVTVYAMALHANTSHHYHTTVAINSIGSSGVHCTWHQCIQYLYRIYLPLLLKIPSVYNTRRTTTKKTSEK